MLKEKVSNPSRQISHDQNVPRKGCFIIIVALHSLDNQIANANHGSKLYESIGKRGQKFREHEATRDSRNESDK